MDKETALRNVLQRCFDARLPVYKVCKLAKVSPGTVTRWRSKPDTIRPSALLRMETALDQIERERAA